MCEEIKLIQQAKKGKRSAQKQIYETYYKYTFVICLRYLKHREDAEDIAHDVFFNFFKNLSSFDEKSNTVIKPWIQTIAVNTCLNFIKKKKPEFFKDDTDEIKKTDSIEAEDSANIEFSNEELRNALETLPEGKRIIFNLHAVDGLKHEEIAEKLEITVGTVRSQYKKAKDILQQTLIQMRNKGTQS